MKKILAFIFVIILIFSTCENNVISSKMTIKIFPGYGIVIDKDSVLLGKIKLDELKKRYNIVTKKGEYIITMWDGYNPKTGKDTGGSYIVENIKYRSLNFNFYSDEDTSKFSLVSIELTNTKNMNVFYNNIDLLKPNPIISEYFPLLKPSDFISPDKLEYKLYSYGVTFNLKKIKNNLFIKSLKVYNKNVD